MDLAKSVWMANAFRTAVLVPRRFARRVPGIRASISKGVIPQIAVHVGILVKAVNRSTRRFGTVALASDGDCAVAVAVLDARRRVLLYYDL